MGVNHIAGRAIRGKDYRPPCGRCDVSPWEVCACSAMLPAAVKAKDEGTIVDLFNAAADARLEVVLMEAG